jgi:hypothetical protein
VALFIAEFQFSFRVAPFVFSFPGSWIFSLRLLGDLFLLVLLRRPIGGMDGPMRG